LKKNNAVYLDNYAQDKVSEKLSAEVRFKDMESKAEKDNGLLIASQI